MNHQRVKGNLVLRVSGPSVWVVCFESWQTSPIGLDSLDIEFSIDHMLLSMIPPNGNQLRSWGSLRYELMIIIEMHLQMWTAPLLPFDLPLTPDGEQRSEEGSSCPRSHCQPESASHVFQWGHGSPTRSLVNTALTRGVHWFLTSEQKPGYVPGHLSSWD